VDQQAEIRLCSANVCAKLADVNMPGRLAQRQEARQADTGEAAPTHLPGEEAQEGGNEERGGSQAAQEPVPLIAVHLHQWDGGLRAGQGKGAGGIA
jgi:hypothetical protein